jgi:hypothetical protein
MAGFLEYLMNPATQGMLNLSAGLCKPVGHHAPRWASDRLWGKVCSRARKV